MSDNVVAFPGFNDLERDLLHLGLTDKISLLRIRDVKKRAEEILWFDYLVELLKRASKGYPIFPDGYNPATDLVPYQYARQFDMLSKRELELLRHWATTILSKDDPISTRSRRELFYVRSEAMRRSFEITKKGNP